MLIRATWSEVLGGAIAVLIVLMASVAMRISFTPPKNPDVGPPDRMQHTPITPLVGDRLDPEPLEHCHARGGRVERGKCTWLPPKRAKPQAQFDESRHTQCLALNIYHEARGEPEEGKQAVAAVTLARAKSGNICRAVYAPKQFSWTHQDVGKASGPAWRDAQRVAKVALLNEMAGRAPIDATHYHAAHVSPKWARSMQRVSTIGNHHFYIARI